MRKRNLNFYDITLEQEVYGMGQMQLHEGVVWLMVYLFSPVFSNPENQKISHDIVRVLGRKAKTFNMPKKWRKQVFGNPNQ